MRRREFIGFVSCATLACSLRVHAQEAGRLYRVALVMPVGRDEPAVLAFLDELRGQGFVEGKNLAIVGGQPTSNEQVPTVVPLILQAAPDAIVSGGDVIARAFQKATQSIPIIVMTEDMVAGGYATSLARPGGNATGISLMSPDLDGKRQDVLIEAVPGARRIAALADSNVASLDHLKALEASARNHGRELVVVRAASASELAPAINEAGKQGAAALNVLSSPMLHLNRRLIIARAAEARLPAIYQWPETAEEGGLLAYGPSFIDIFRQRAGIVVKVLRGARPSELPIEQPTKFKLVINLKTAKAINYAVPTGLVLRADTVIE
ncbi:MAG TPA: ABC transporter substrate-binding protein [Candidatus Binatia bacterium]|jgi:putative ABC transport system substrate-binding protein|nr:ABC transporter substrate-binding protein [Candidatus Binatia bacterium]